MTRFKEIMNQYPFFCDILETLDEAVYFCYIDGRLLYINKVAERLDGYTNEELYGSTVGEAYGLDERTSPMLLALTTEKSVVDKAFRYNVNGREVYQICNARSVFYKGKKVGAYTIQKDVTQLMEVIEQNISLQKKCFCQMRMIPRNLAKILLVQTISSESILFSRNVRKWQ